MEKQNILNSHFQNSDLNSLNVLVIVICYSYFQLQMCLIMLLLIIILASLVMQTSDCGGKGGAVSSFQNIVCSFQFHFFILVVEGLGCYSRRTL